MVVEAETKSHTVEATCTRVHSSIGLYSPSWTYIHLGSFSRAADFSMTGLCSPSWTYMN